MTPEEQLCEMNKLMKMTDKEAADILEKGFSLMSVGRQNGKTWSRAAYIVALTKAIMKLRLDDKNLEWIPIKDRPMTDEEYFEFRREFGEIPEDERKSFDCKMPENGQKILITTCWGVDLDECDYDIDSGYGLVGRGDWDGVLAWMPLPEPYKSEVKND